LKILKEDISCLEILDYLNLDKNTYMLSLNNKLTKLHIFLKQTPRNIKTNVFSTHDVHLFSSNIDIQFISNPYVGATYCKSLYDKNR
jgi:hypothetical protein